MARLELIFPPLTGVNYPYLSTAVLKAYVEANSSHSVGQHDVNLALVNWLLSPDTVAYWAERADQALVELERRDELALPESLAYARAFDLRLQAPSLVAALPQALEVVRDPRAIHDPEVIAAADRVIAGALDAASATFPGEHLSFSEPVWRYSASSPSELQAGIADQDCLANQLVAAVLDPAAFENADAVGISIVYHGQVLPALCMAARLKRARPGLPIVVGGPFFTVHRKMLAQEPWLFDLVDAFVVFEGETPLVGWLDWLDGRRRRDEVAGLVWREDGKVLDSGAPVPVDINELPCPDFGGLPLGSYHLPAPTLPLLASRGCYWDCAFCTHHYIYGDTYRVRSRELIAADLRALEARHGCQHVYFVDESLSPRLLRHISQASLEAGGQLRWGCELRAEKALTREDLDLAASSGCRVFSFGVESANQRVLDSMNKGVQVADVSRLLRDCRASGIASHLMFIVGFPGETAEELEDTLTFVADNGDLISMVGFSYFVLLRHSPVERQAALFGLDAVRDLAPDLGFEERRAYRTTRGLTSAEAFDLWLDVQRRPELQAPLGRAGHGERDRFLFDRGRATGAGPRLMNILAAAPIEVDMAGHDMAAAQALSGEFLVAAGRRYNLTGQTLAQQLAGTSPRIGAIPSGEQFLAFNPSDGRSHVLGLAAARALAAGERPRTAADPVQTDLALAGLVGA